MKNGKNLFDEDNSIIFNSLKLVLRKRKDYLLGNAIWGSLKTDKELDDIERVLKLIETQKIQINGKFRIEKTLGRESENNNNVCWESVYSLGREIEEYTGKQGWATIVLQETIIKTIAKKQGLLISKKKKDRWGEVLDEGTEAQIYDDPDNKTKVIKTFNYLVQNKSLPDFFERTIGFNRLFPETKYDILGFFEEKLLATAYSRDKMLKPVLRQPFVYGTIINNLPNPEKEHAEFLLQFQRLGYEVNFEDETITKDCYEASDLNWGNIKKFKGQYYVIDAWVRRV